MLTAYKVTREFESISLQQAVLDVRDSSQTARNPTGTPAKCKGLITSLIAAIVGKPDFSAITFQINGSKFPVGDFINAVFSFVLVATAIYFFVVLPVNAPRGRLLRERVDYRALARG